MTPICRDPDVAAAPDAIEKTLDFVKASRLQGGANIQAALAEALAQSAGESHIVLLGDGGATRGGIQNGKLGRMVRRAAAEEAGANSGFTPEIMCLGLRPSACTVEW